MWAWRLPSSCMSSEADDEVLLAFLQRDLLQRIIEYFSETVILDRFFYKFVDVFTLYFTFDIAVGTVADIAAQLIPAGDLYQSSPEADTLNDTLVNDIIAFHILSL